MGSLTSRTPNTVRLSAFKKGKPTMYMSESTLLWLLEGISERNFHYADTGEDIDPTTLIPKGDLEVTATLKETWESYENVLRIALIEWLIVPENFSGLSADSAESMADALIVNHDAPYAVFMTLNGEGVGIWDGRWGEMLTDAQIESLSKHLKGRLHDFADGCGSGSDNEALDEATYKRTPVQRCQDELIAAERERLDAEIWRKHN